MRPRTAISVTAGLAAMLLFLTASCTVRQQIELGREGGGNADVAVELHPMVVRYITDLIVFSGGPEPDSIFDPAAIEAAFNSIPELTLRGLDITGPGILRLELDFTNIESLFTYQMGTKVPTAARVTRKKSSSEAFLYLDRDNYAAIVARVLVLSGMVAFEDYLTGLLEPGPEEVILDMYEYAFEEYAGEKSVREVIAESKVVLEFVAPKEIISHRGGKLPDDEKPDGRVLFIIPLLDILTLDEPITYSFLFR